MRHGRRYVIGCHEDCAKHESATKQRSHRVGVNWVGKVQKSAEYEHRGENAYRYVPCYDFLPKHVCQAYKERYGAHLAYTSGTVVQSGVAEQHGHRARKLLQYGSVAGLYRRLHNAQRRRGGLRIYVRSQLTGHRPRRHLRRERGQKEATAYQRGIERIAAKASESHLADAYCHQRAYYNNPHGKVGRQVEAKQQARQYGRTVHDGWLPFQHIFGYRPLKEHTCGHA